MEKENFVKILEKHKVPADVHDKWWNDLTQHHFIFCCNDSEHALLDFFVGKAMEKGCARSAPW